jgi:hypothetical protein
MQNAKVKMQSPLAALPLRSALQDCVLHSSGGCRGFVGPVPLPLWIRVFVLVAANFTLCYVLCQTYQQ